MKKVLIVEDNDASRKMIKTALLQTDKNLQIYETGNAEEACGTAMYQTIELFVVDIILRTDIPGDVSGMLFVDWLRGCEQYKYVPVIIISSLEDLKLNAYSHLHCHSYLEKPVSIERMKQVFKEALDMPAIRKKKDYLYLRKDGILYSVRRKDILYIVVGKKESRIICRKEEIESTYKSCKSFLEELDSRDFIQCSRSTIVNRRHIKMVDATNRYILLDDQKSSVEIGVIMKKRFLEQLNEER